MVFVSRAAEKLGLGAGQDCLSISESNKSMIGMFAIRYSGKDARRSDARRSSRDDRIDAPAVAPRGRKRDDLVGGRQRSGEVWRCIEILHIYV